MPTATIADRLERVARRHVEGSIPPDPSGELAAMDLSRLLIVYGNWRGRFVSRRSRKVHLSRELAREVSNSKHQTALANVCNEIAVGADLTPRLSTGVEVAYVATAHRKTGGGLDLDLDAMLAHDGLHHLHLGADEGGRVVARSRDLLFAAFRQDDAYVVGVYPHGSWGRLELLERIVRNWPNAKLMMEAKSVTGLTQHYSDEDRWRAMKAGVSVLTQIDGRAYCFVQTAAGTPNAVTDRVNAFMWELTYIREQGIDERLRQRGADPSLYWVATVRGDLVGLESSQGFVAFGRLA